MDPIESAERRYRQIVPNPGVTWSDVQVRKLTDWLKGDVTPIVAGYVGRLRFQNAACWPLREFVGGANTPARIAVDRVSAALVQCAQDIRNAIKSRRIENAIQQVLSQKSVAAAEEVRIGGRASKVPRREVNPHDATTVFLSQVDGIAKPFWSDLVSPEDYFEPRAGWLDDGKTDNSTAGEFVVALNPELPPVGDFVTRCLTRRVDVLAREVETHGQAVVRAANSLGLDPPKAVTAIPASLEHLRTVIRELYAICGLEPEAMIRDSCIVLTQTYNAYHPTPDLGCLGRPETDLIHAAGVFRHRITNLRDIRATDRIATALGDLRRLYDGAPPGQSALEEAIASGGLVLTETPAAYWAGDLIECDWVKHSQCWKMLRQMARRARLGVEVREADLYSMPVSPSTMANVSRRLKDLLPATLRREIVSGIRPRSYRLKLSSDRIHIMSHSAPNE